MLKRIYSTDFKKLSYIDKEKFFDNYFKGIVKCPRYRQLERYIYNKYGVFSIYEEDGEIMLSIQPLPFAESLEELPALFVSELFNHEFMISDYDYKDFITKYKYLLKDSSFKDIKTLYRKLKKARKVAWSIYQSDPEWMV